MQTLFLVWLPGLGGFLAGVGVLIWLGGKGLEAVAKARAIQGADRMTVDSAQLLKEVCGVNAYFPDDLQRRIDRQIAQVEAMTRKELT